MHHNKHKLTKDFLDLLASNSYLQYITQSSRHKSHSRTLIDSIFSNVISKDIICGIITATNFCQLLANFCQCILQ